MKLHSFIVLFLFTLFGLNAQESIFDLNFFFDLGIKDAHLEESFVGVDLKDEEDFWSDQKRFEKQLLKANKQAYQAYINGKNVAYRKRFDECKGECIQSEFYYRQASFYVSEATLESEVSGLLGKNPGKK